MIQQRTVLKVSDNSGAKTVRCIKVLSGFKKRYAKLGDTVVVSVQQLRNRSKKTSKVKKKDIYRALIIRTRIIESKLDGSKYFFKDNAVVLMNKQGNPIGTRVIGPISKTLKKKNLQKVLSLSSGLT